MRVQLKKQEEQLAATVVSRDEAAACVRVVREERAQMKREWSEMFAAHDGLQQRIAVLQRQVAEERTAAQVRPGWEGAGPCCVCCAARAPVLRAPMCCARAEAVWRATCQEGTQATTLNSGAGLRPRVDGLCVRREW